MASTLIVGSSITASGNVDFNGDLDVDGTTNLDVVDIDGAVNMASTLIVGSSITASGGISSSGDISTGQNLEVEGSGSFDTISAASLTLNKNITIAAATDASFYAINGNRVEVRSQLQGSIAADTGFTLELRNTSVAANSLIVANVIGGEGAIVTGSVVSANVVAANTASLNFFNIGEAIADNAKFTASIAIL